MSNEKLKMSFDPHTIEHLGIKMYSRLPNAIAELIANAYDADAHNVYISIIDSGNDKSISVKDDGIGMAFEEINEKFLRIGRKRRIDDNGLSPSGKRKVTGRKGLGKLAFFGIGNTIEIQTNKLGKTTNFTMNWNDIINSKGPDYEPSYSIRNSDGEIGTTIILRDLKRQSGIDKISLAISLSKLFNFFDETFKVFISLNGDENLLIDDKLKYQNLNAQINWTIPDNPAISSEYLNEHNISGEILSTEKPLKPDLRGITLFAHGRLVNAPEFFGVGESSHGYSYFTGWLNVDFIDEWEEDVISTDRQSLNWDLPLTEELRQKLQEVMHLIERDWREKRKIERTKKISTQTGIDVGAWYTKLPPKVKTGVESIVNAVVNDSELETEKQKAVVNDLHELLPEYTYYHYRHLHDTIKNSSEHDYQNRDYYRAFEESMKRYVLEVQRKSGLTDTDHTLMNNAFGKDKLLTVTKKYKRRTGDDFNLSTITNIEEGQRWLSAGVMTGARNPIAHEEISELRDSGLFSENDCLDLLSLLSHLFRRLDDAEKR
ncbi:MAG: TIGR02391 family protein [Treponema sp.]|uniref:TIGR02391 family protein n=1 Tax=Treponema sp. TaxID=166 RepID=UPI00298EBF25|nr:TIGR02391 family protein [Treponema sp.]MBR5932992.1 TIGR02391 family protein [Treponema sp.]